VRFYDPDSGKQTGSLEPTGSPIQALAFSPDGTLIATGDEDGRVRLWHLKERRLLLTMIGFSGLNRGKVSPDWIAFTPDGYYDWSPGAARLIRWRLNGKLYPANAFEKELKRPTLLRQP